MIEFTSEEQEKKQELIDKLMEICAELGWVVGVNEEHTSVGLVVGRENYVVEILEQVEDGAEYSIFRFEEELKH